nr:LysR family transcriptional regulator [Cupriavidus necator]
MLHVSQPAVNRVLALTESRLGYPLFERARQAVADAGRAAPVCRGRAGL